MIDSERGLVLLKCDDSPLRRLKSWRKKTNQPSLKSFEQPLICSKLRFACFFQIKASQEVLFNHNWCETSIVQVLTGGCSPHTGMEAFRVVPFVQLCILNLLGISCCVAQVCVDVCVCTSIHSVFHLCCEGRPPSASLTRTHVQVCTGRPGEGGNHVNLCGRPASDYGRSPTP